jgi:hypothetical protein
MIFTISLYRQIAIGITIKHLQIRLKQLLKESQSEETIHKLFAWQTGHSIEQEIQSYGLDGDYPTQLQPLLFDLYWSVSEAWHQWLELSHPTALPSLPESSLKPVPL